MITRQTLRIPELDNGLQIPYFDIRGEQDGPRLTVLAGVHGAEYASIAAAREFVSSLDVSQVSGQIVVVPVVNVPAFWARSAFVVPADGKNLNRSFPGDPAGSYSEVLAHTVFEQLVLGSDYLVDLHAGDLPRRWSRSRSMSNRRSNRPRATWRWPTAWLTACGSRPRPGRSRAAPARRRPTPAFRPSLPNPVRTG